MKISSIILPVALCGALLAFAPKASAIPSLSVGDSYYLGYANPGTPAAANNQVDTFLNGLIGLALGGSGTAVGSTIVRSSNNFGDLSGVSVSGTAGNFTDFGSAPTSVDVTGLTFISIHYGNNGQQFWYVGNLTGFYSVPSKYTGLNNGGGISGVLGFDGITRTNKVSVPDGGTTALLLGAVLSGLGMMARRFKK